VTLLATAFENLRGADPLAVRGRVSAVRGLVVLVDELPLPVGSTVEIERPDVVDGDKRAAGEVIGFSREQTIVMMLGSLEGVRPGQPVLSLRTTPTARVGWGLVGRVVDGLGRPIDGRGPLGETVPRRLSPPPLNAMQRTPIRKPLRTGVRVLDLLTPVGAGQRLGIFAGPGVGKSTLLAGIAKRCEADVAVVALIGERGREVREFIEHGLGAEGMARSVVVAATGDESPLMRARAAKHACCAAEFFRDAGKRVMLIMDSVTRFAHAQRQIGLAAGEPPTARGYTPSVFARLAELLERAGAVDGACAGGGGGSITGLYTVLVEGDDMTEPVADAARGILDGHVVLSRKLAQRGHYPAVDVLDSVSRVAGEICDKEHLEAQRALIRLIALHREVEDLVQIGAYARGVNPLTDAAIDMAPKVAALLMQNMDQATPFDAARAGLMGLVKESNELVLKAVPKKARS